MQPTLSVTRIILYVKDIPKVAAFYAQHFGMQPLPGADAGWLEFASPAGGTNIALHQASPAQKSGSAVKIVFGVLNVEGFIANCAANGLIFGPIHRAPGFEYANAKDPAGNSISISSRGMR